MRPPEHIAGRYRLISQLGRGGMGEVWLAHDARLDRHVAIKLLRDPLDAQHAARFEREARAVAALVHPNIVNIFDFGNDESRLFIAMEFVAGEPLSETIRHRRPLPLGMRLRLMEELCAGVGHAHRRGIIHRDIKPANLIIGGDGHLKVVDFGIARRGVSTLTQGYLIGSLHYMSPEQLSLQPVDPRSDIFSVGAVCYEFFSGEMAFPGTTAEAVAARIRQGPEPLDRLCPDLDPQIVNIVMEALAVEPDRRFQELAAMQRALESCRLPLASDESAEAETRAISDLTETAGRAIAEPPRRRTDRDALERRRATDVRLRIEEAQAALDIGDYAAAAQHAEQALLLDPSDAEAAELLERANAAVDAGSDTDVPRAKDLLGRIQARLIDKRCVIDYAFLTVAGLFPLLLAIATGAWENTRLPPGGAAHESCAVVGKTTIVGYGSRPNWWPYFAALPFVLFLLRLSASRFFPLQPSPATINRGLLLRIDERHRGRVASRLAAAALDRRNLLVVLVLGVVINVIDVFEVASLYVEALRTGGLSECPRELDWTVHFISGGSGIGANAALTAAAYFNQFVLHCLSMMAYGLLLRHNWFYLRTIYQRARAKDRPEGEFIVLNFDDVERCFGLRVLHGTFNLQIIILILGGILISSTRVMNVDPTIVSEHYEAALARVFSTAAQQTSEPSRALMLSDLFPDPGQVMLAFAWVFCFAVVAMPGAVKFLPFFYKHLTIVGRKEYLTSFIPPRGAPRTDTQETLDALAEKFARSAFWPAGDERARTLYTFAYIVFFFVLVPMPPARDRYVLAHFTVLLAAALFSTRVTFWLFRKALANVDASLA